MACTLLFVYRDELRARGFSSYDTMLSTARILLDLGAVEMSVLRSDGREIMAHDDIVAHRELMKRVMVTSRAV